MADALSEVLGEVLVAADGEEVAVSALAARGVSLVGLYFGCSLGGPCAQLGSSLAAFYGRFRGEAAAGGGQRLEIVFVSAEQEQQQWQEAVRAMPWLALPFADKHRKVRPRSGAGRGARPALCLGTAGSGAATSSAAGTGTFQKVPGGNRGRGKVGGSCRLPSHGATPPRSAPSVPGWETSQGPSATGRWRGGDPGQGFAIVRAPTSPSEERGRRRVRRRRSGSGAQQHLAGCKQLGTAGLGGGSGANPVGLQAEKSHRLQQPWEGSGGLRSELELGSPGSCWQSCRASLWDGVSELLLFTSFSSWWV